MASYSRLGSLDKQHRGCDQQLPYDFLSLKYPVGGFVPSFLNGTLKWEIHYLVKFRSVD